MTTESWSIELEEKGMTHFRHPAYRHEHPTLTAALKVRTRTFGTVNLAVALRGRSCGWGTCGKPRRTFIGHHKINRLRGRHFIELSITRGLDFTATGQTHTFHIPLDRRAVSA